MEQHLNDIFEGSCHFINFKKTIKTLDFKKSKQ